MKDPPCGGDRYHLGVVELSVVQRTLCQDGDVLCSTPTLQPAQCQAYDNQIRGGNALHVEDNSYETVADCILQSAEECEDRHCDKTDCDVK